MIDNIIVDDDVSAHSGVYGLCNMETDQWYIGAAVDLARRSRQYCRTSQRVNHRLQKAFDTHGRSAFVFLPLYYLIDGADQFDLLAAEEHLIVCYDSINDGYNLRKAEIGDPGDAYKAMLKTTMHTKEAFAKHIVSLKRTLALPETKAKYAKIAKDRWADPAYKARVSKSLVKVWTPEMRQARSEQTKARWADPEYKRKTSLAIQVAKGSKTDA